MALYTNRDLLKKQAEAKAKAEKEAQEKKQAEVTNEAAGEEVLNEIAIYRSEKDNMLITIDNGETDRGFGDRPFLKVYNSSSQAKASKISRIYFLNGPVQFENHKNSNGKENWTLDGPGNYKKKFVEAMKAAPNTKNAKGENVWQAAIYGVLDVAHKQYDPNTEMPDFNNILPSNKKNKRR